MTDELICFETAKLAKEIEFDETCTRVYNPQNVLIALIYSNSELRGKSKDYYTCPTQSLLQRWLREKHNIDIYPNMIHNITGDKEYVCFYYFTDMLRGYLVDRKEKRLRFPSYELALEAGLKSACEYVKDK